MTIYTATWNGETTTRVSTRVYTHASVVRWWDGTEQIVSFHGTESAALRGTLTADQRHNGAAVIAAVPVSTDEAVAANVRTWLLKYAWNEDSDDAKRRVVECIMAQDGWRFIDAIADKFAGAQEEPGPAAYNEGTVFALSALYECHDAPHLATCPMAPTTVEEK